MLIRKILSNKIFFCKFFRGDSSAQCYRGYVPGGGGGGAITPMHTMLRKEVSGEVVFLHVSKHQFFYKLILSFLMGLARHSQSI